MCCFIVFPFLLKLKIATGFQGFNISVKNNSCKLNRDVVLNT